MSPVSQRTCILHIGTHKTGSTALQLFLNENREALESTGLHLLRAGREGEMNWGNHHLAWELLSNDDGPVQRALRDELNSLEERVALITAEDLALLPQRPAALTALCNTIRAAGFEPKVITYLRAQGTLAESMYGQRVHSDQAIRRIAPYIDEILTTGQYRLENGGVLEYDYARLLSNIESVTGRESVFAKAYRTDGNLSQIFYDFLETLALAAPALDLTKPKLSVSYAVANLRLRFVQILATAYMHIFPGVSVPEEPTEFLRRFAPTVDEQVAVAPFQLFSRDEHLAFIRAFAESNLRVERSFATRLQFASADEVPEAKDAQWEITRLQRETYDRCVDDWLSGMRSPST